jgi:hypothetical protein
MGGFSRSQARSFTSFRACPELAEGMTSGAQELAAICLRGEQAILQGPPWLRQFTPAGTAPAVRAMPRSHATRCTRFFRIASAPPLKSMAARHFGHCTVAAAQSGDRFFRNRGCVPRQCARKNHESRSVMAPEIKSVTMAYVLRRSLMTPITLSTRATGGHVSRRNPARARHGLLQLGLSRSIRTTDNPAAARTCAAILP